MWLILSGISLLIFVVFCVAIRVNTFRADYVAVYSVFILIFGTACILLSSRYVDYKYAAPYELKVENSILNDDPNMRLYEEVKDFLEENYIYRIYDRSHLEKLENLNEKLGTILVRYEIES